MKAKKTLFVIFVALLLTLPLLLSNFAMASVADSEPPITNEPRPTPAEYFRVVFDANGGSWADGDVQKISFVQKGDLIYVGGFMGLPSKDSSEPLSWNTNADGTGKTWNFAVDRVDGDITLYAQYTALAAAPAPSLPQTGNAQSTLLPLLLVAAIAAVACIVISRRNRA